MQWKWQTLKKCSKDCLVAVAYARQLPKNDCHIVEQYTRQFNYPKQSRVKTKADIPTLGIKTFSVQMSVRHIAGIYLKNWGFESPVIFNEDMFLQQMPSNTDMALRMQQKQR